MRLKDLGDQGLAMGGVVGVPTTTITPEEAGDEIEKDPNGSNKISSKNKMM